MAEDKSDKTPSTNQHGCFSKKKLNRTGLNTLQFFISNKEIVGSFQRLPPKVERFSATYTALLARKPSNPLMLQNHSIYYDVSYRREQHPVHGFKGLTKCLTASVTGVRSRGPNLELSPKLTLTKVQHDAMERNLETLQTKLPSDLPESTLL